jgi:diguanylate cyclase (GGDEF)-like protein
LKRIEEIAAGLRAIFCLNDETIDDSAAGCAGTCFKQISRCVPELLYKRVNHHKYDVVFIHKDVALDAVMQETITKIRTNHPKTILFVECEDSHTERILQAIHLNVDKTILTSMDHDEFCEQVERTITPHFELELNARYEKHLEEIIYGKTKELQNKQHIDVLTGFKNGEALKEAFGDHQQKGILFLDIDKFDTINTLYGMKMGDEVLKFVAKRLARFLPENTSIYRISADEFALLVDEPKERQIEHLADQVITMFSESPIVIADNSFDIHFSIGTHYGPEYDIFYNAKLANREAKSMGGKICVHYRDESHFLKSQQENHYWTNELKNALKEDRILVYYQPIYDTNLSCIDKYEALVRLQTVAGDIITPNFFLQQAVSSGLITNLSRIVIDKTFKMFSNNELSFSFNLSDQDFAEGYLKEFLKYKCEVYNIKPERVYIEILEETSLNGSDDFLDQIHALRKLGFKFSIDDFGIDKSNFSRVLDLEAEIIKIDGSFIRDFEANDNNHIIINSIVDFAKKIGAKTVAEFVEQESTLHYLREIGVDYAQGYLIGKPDPTLTNCYCNI